MFRMVKWTSQNALTFISLLDISLLQSGCKNVISLIPSCLWRLKTVKKEVQLQATNLLSIPCFIGFGIYMLYALKTSKCFIDSNCSQDQKPNSIPLLLSDGYLEFDSQRSGRPVPDKFPLTSALYCQDPRKAFTESQSYLVLQSAKYCFFLLYRFKLWWITTMLFLEIL